ncbi:MAG: sialidase family protein [Candidatus Latescibacterota bacterium]
MFDMTGIFDREEPFYAEGSLWGPHTVEQRIHEGAWAQLPALMQIVTEKWNVRSQVPYLVYMPETDRLLMLLNCEHQPVVIFSDDRGATWSAPRFVHPDLCIKPDRFFLGVGLAYLGEGKVILSSAEGSDRATSVWLSQDYGAHWEDFAPMPAAFDGKPCRQWDPFLVDRNKKTGTVERIALAGYTLTTDANHTRGFIRFSTDKGQTWSPDIVVPQWDRKNEIALTRVGNGDILAACRLDPSDENLEKIDHYTGFAVSISKDNGHTWSEAQTLYKEGRHHTSTVLLPNGDLVMSYVVRSGLPDTPDGFKQFGVEAIVSHDHGQSWDLDHLYLLAKWQADRKGENAWWRSVQATSSVLLPDGWICTAFGTYFRSQPAGKGLIRPLDVGLIKWQVR